MKADGAPLSLDRKIEIAAQLAVRARAYFDAFKFLEDIETRPHIVAVLEKYHWYFWHQHHTHRYAFIVEIAGLFKRKRGTVNFPVLLDGLRPHLPEGQAAGFAAKLNSVVPTAAKAELIRSNALAHRSADVELDDVFRKASVTRSELEALSDMAIELANAFSAVRNLPKVMALTKESYRDMRRLFVALGAKFPISEDDDWLEGLFSG